METRRDNRKVNRRVNPRARKVDRRVSRGQTGGQQNGARSSGDPRGGGRQSGGPDQRGGYGGYWGDDRQLGSELRERLPDAQNLRREWGTTGAPARQLDEGTRGSGSMTRAIR